MPRLRTLSFLTFFIMFIQIGGCQSNGGGKLEVGIIFHDHRHAPPPQQKGPPAHAPAHGRRHKQKYTYHYYPSAEIYFSPASGLYFYYDNSQWRSSVKLTNELKVTLGSTFVTLDMDTDKPYRHHKDHVQKYPPGLAKQKDKRGKGRGQKNKNWK